MIDVSAEFQKNIYGMVRKFSSRVKITLFGEETLYDDETIIKMNILEDMSTLNETVPSDEIQLTLDNSSGDFNFLNFQNMHTILASKPKIVAELGLVYSSLADPNIEIIEWVPCGVFFLTEWKNDITNRIITLTGNDLFTQLSEISYTPVGITNLRDLAIDVLTKAGVSAENLIVDESLNITVNALIDRIDSRTALQWIAIAGRTSVFQDRVGKIVIRPFRVLDESSNYLVYPTTQLSLFNHVSANTYILNNTGGGMRYLDFEQMYDPPEVSLEKSIFQLVIKVYHGGVDGEIHEHVHQNEVIEGTNGQSFTIDVPLVESHDMAHEIAQWYFRENNYNAHYKVKWRQNPALECSDIVLVEDSFGAEKQSRVIRQEINYSGYLEGITETRGGL